MAEASVPAEWLETDGLGGFASGVVDGPRSRRYHALLLVARRPPTDRVVLVNGFDAWVETPSGRFPIARGRYANDVVHPQGGFIVESFTRDPWPRWTLRLDDGTRVVQEIFVVHGHPQAALSWRVEENGPHPYPLSQGERGSVHSPSPGGRGDRGEGIRLTVRPLLSGRDYHALHHENGVFWSDAEIDRTHVTWRPYAGVPGVRAASNGAYAHEPVWYRSVLYAEERDRGLDHAEDLASPGTFTFDLARGEAVLLLGAELAGQPLMSWPDPARGAAAVPRALDAQRLAEHARRTAFRDALDRAADAYVVERGGGRTIVAGYPWFTDWGRDTFIAVRGLALATDRLDDARAILLEWAAAVSQGMLPNRFPDQGDVPEFNAVDASLWYVVAVHEYLERASAAGVLDDADAEVLRTAVLAIVNGYAAGTRHGIVLDADGLLRAGERGQQLTWMDARVGDREITPRIGKPVEIQALWLNAVRVAETLQAGTLGDIRWHALFERGVKSFRARFWNEAAGCLHDVVDVDHQPGTADATFRPNQILAVGGLPYPILDGERATRVVAAIEERLLTPLGLRTLDPADPAYAPRCAGGVAERDGAYHQGTVWPWLLGPFVEAWVRVRGGGDAVRREARKRFVEPLLRHLDAAGLGHVSEIADGDAPHTPRGCPWQAWSLGELLRLERVVLAVGADAESRLHSPSPEGRGDRGEGADEGESEASAQRSVRFHVVRP